MDTENRLVKHFFTLFGPFDLNMGFEGEVIDLPSKMSKMTETRGIWGENNVTHEKVEGQLLYYPHLDSGAASPTTQFPDRVGVPVYDYLGNAITAYADMGLFFHGNSGRQILNSLSMYQQAYEYDHDNCTYIVYRVGTRNSTTILGELYKDRVDVLRPKDSQYVYVTYTHEWHTLPAGGLPTAYDWRERQTLDTIRDCVLSRPIGGSTLCTDTLQRWYRFRLPDNTVLSPTRIAEHIDSIIRQLIPGTYPVDELPYGDLAMEASEKTLATAVNVIALLKDLRKPLELVPKLKQLTKLKTIANNYLTFKYGILPTIDDLQGIVGAFMRVKPYLDKFGLSTYSAGCVDSCDIQGFSYSLEQHIKLAIANEDDELQALVTRLESMGTLPTFENLWDLVPFSFVVDWFVDVGSFLERVDSSLRLLRLNINYVTSSRKKIVDGVLRASVGSPYSGPVKWVHYHRWVSDQCPLPPPPPTTSFQGQSHWLEASALLIQRR